MKVGRRQWYADMLLVAHILYLVLSLLLLFLLEGHHVSAFAVLPLRRRRPTIPRRRAMMMMVPKCVGISTTATATTPMSMVAMSMAAGVQDPAHVEFAPSEYGNDNNGNDNNGGDGSSSSINNNIPPEQQQPLSTAAKQAAIEDFDPEYSFYPYAAMMQGSAPYIAKHVGEIAVFHIPGDIAERASVVADTDVDDNSDNDDDDDNDDSNLPPKSAADVLFSDIAVSWLLGMKIVLVVASRFKTTGDSAADDGGGGGAAAGQYPHEYHNTLSVTDSETLRQLAEDAGYLRTEVERRLNRYLQPTKGENAPLEGNVVSGNWYTAQRLGMVRGTDFHHTGLTTKVHVENIKRVLENKDIVLLSTVGMNPLGDLVNVNGYHLAATVAASLDAHKLIYMASQDSILKENGKPIQDISVSDAREITNFHQVNVHRTGFATFEGARRSLNPEAVEMLLHLGWGSWAIENGVQRAHIVNPGDGALLEELFTSKNGANTCLFDSSRENPVELEQVAASLHNDVQQESHDQISLEDWNGFFT